VGLWLKNAAGGRKRSGDREIARDRAAEKSWQSATVELPAIGMISHKEIATIAMDRAKNARMENQLQTAQPGPATKVLKSSTKGRRKK
jgi:hypothetical protein